MYWQGRRRPGMPTARQARRQTRACARPAPWKGQWLSGGIVVGRQIGADPHGTGQAQGHLRHEGYRALTVASRYGNASTQVFGVTTRPIVTQLSFPALMSWRTVVVPSAMRPATPGNGEGQVLERELLRQGLACRPPHSISGSAAIPKTASAKQTKTRGVVLIEIGKINPKTSHVPRKTPCELSKVAPYFSCSST